MTGYPHVKVLDAIMPHEMGSSVLKYPDLDNRIGEQLPHLANRWHELEATSGIPEETIARELAEFYLLQTVKKYNFPERPDSSKLWAERFSLASTELYGQPQQRAAAQIAQDALTQFVPFIGSDNIDQNTLAGVLDLYYQVAAKETTSDISEIAREDIETYHNVLDQDYGSILALTENYPQGAKLSPDQLVDLFNDALEILKGQNEAWTEWNIVSDESSMAFVRYEKKEVHIGNRRPAATLQEAKALLAHELLVHALRPVNASLFPEGPLRRAFPNYSVFEEGLGIFHEYIVTGEVPEKATDRYFDIGLALGINNSVQLSRKQLFEFAFSRAKLRLQIAKEPYEEKDLLAKTWAHVDRIFRGSPGSDDIAEQGVFTKDIAYYDGFLKVKQFITEQREQGKSIKEIYLYMLRAKFDPTNRLHRKYLEQEGGVSF